MTGRATVYDVAKAAGVSIKTVSRVVNGADNVTDETRRRVLAAVAELDYVRNAAAHSLRTGSSKAIGVIVDSLADPFFATLVSVVESRALAQGISVLVASTGRSLTRERDQVARLASQNVCGLLLASVENQPGSLREVTKDIPVVLIDRGIPGEAMDVVRVHDRHGARTATEHLLAHGHRRIAFLGDRVELPTIVNRQGGYLDALVAAGSTPDDTLIRNDGDEIDTAAAAVTELLALHEPPTAIFAASPRSGMGVVRALHAAGRTDIGLVSFGDFALADCLTPAVTVIDQDPAPIAAAAADRLLARVDGRTPVPAEIVLPLTLIARGSGEVPPCSRS